jgi:A/G-specific adenine glycosylase
LASKKPANAARKANAARVKEIAGSAAVAAVAVTATVAADTAEAAAGAAGASLADTGSRVNGDIAMGGSPKIAEAVIAWQKKHGRHHLPWQNTRDAYRIWVSEIMLQQTQVAAVIGYYARFMARFPDVASLSRAPDDEVMRHWAGLGYYSRARNLHAAARMVMNDFGGAFPRTQAALVTLPGVGRSTAAAIAAFAFCERAAILDGNVKRVFARHFGIEGWPSTSANEARLWEIAEAALPDRDIVAYTQGLMDLGATLCVRSRPLCALCPLTDSCVARREGRTHELPASKPKKTIPQRRCVMLVLRQQNHVLLEKRPPVGIWGGLMCLPQFDDEVSAERAAGSLGAAWPSRERLKDIAHGFTHYHLTITPYVLRVGALQNVAEAARTWVPIASAVDAGVPAPVKKLLAAVLSSEAS